MAIVALIFVLLFFPVAGHTATYDASHYRSFIKDSSGSWKMVNSSNGNITITSGNGGGTVHSNKNLSLPTSKGGKLANLSYSALTNIGKLGSALANFAKKGSPAGLAIGTAFYICEQTGICDIDGQWQKQGDPSLAGYPSTVPESNGRWSSGTSPVVYFYSPESACSYSGRNYGDPNLYELDHVEYVTDSNYSCYARRLSDGAVIFNGSTIKSAGCPTNYVSDGNGTCVLQGTYEPTPATDADWEQAANDLNQPGTTDHLINNGQNVPIIDPGVELPTLDDAPIQLPIASDTSTVTDGQGNNIGSQTKETTLNIDSAATPDNPELLDLTETTITTNYDINNNIIDQSTTITETSQPSPDPQPTNYTVEFDTVTDTPLQEKIIEAPLTTTSWGGGTCPPDIDMVLSVGSFVFESQPFCDFAIALNPLILLVASIIGAYIVITSGRPQTA